jgi:hypothetical protein
MQTLPVRERNPIRTFLLGLVLFLVYEANQREIDSSDTWPNRYQPVAIIRGDGIYLDRFHDCLLEGDGKLPYCVAVKDGRLVSRYPLAPAILSVPLFLPQVLLLDWLQPGWEGATPRARGSCAGMSKNAAAIIVVLAVLVLRHLLFVLGLGPWATPAALTTGLASNYWAVASQSLWQHGPAVLALTLALVLLVQEQPSRARLFGAGLAVAVMVACRSIDVVLAVPILLWVAWYQPRGLVWFLPGPLLLGVLLLAFNVYFFGRIEGGIGEVEDMHQVYHNVPGTWSGNLLEGAAGTLFSPSRGLFVFCPWALIALATLPAVWSQLRPFPLISWCIMAIVPYGLMLAKYSVWWGGAAFGPRYWIDVFPLFAVCLSFGLQWAFARSGSLFAVFVSTIIFSIGVQMIGAFYYPSSWFETPTVVDRDHPRLWDWRDSELSRCVEEGLLGKEPPSRDGKP